jgi:proteasome lid subunit RPN8/RPN11
MSDWDLTQAVRDRVYGHAYAFPNAEVGGILVGTFPSADQPATVVLGVLPAFDARGDLTSLTFTHEAWADIHAMKEVQFPNAAIVGWYHTHPGHGIFLSEHDLFVHRNFFPHEASLAYVVDPLRHEEGLFSLDQGDLAELWIRPVDSAEAIADRRSTSRRGPGARGGVPGAAAANEPPPTTAKPRGERPGSGAGRQGAARPPRPATAEPASSLLTPAVEETLTDVGLLAAAVAIGVLVARIVLGG